VATFANLWAAFLKADNQKFVGTDDTQLLERAGIRVKIVPCSYQNIKITFLEDLIVAKQILKKFHE
jgi:2-C-methyl-D-erythritol 4-phosphate cytidylyltransferase